MAQEIIVILVNWHEVNKKSYVLRISANQAKLLQLDYTASMWRARCLHKTTTFPGIGVDNVARAQGESMIWFRAILDELRKSIS
jgi:hypothetical protein